jgi:flagellar protein FlgJ
MSIPAPATGTSRNAALDQRFALDVQGVDALRRTVRNSPDEGLKQVSRQFEAMFMNMVLKSMRDATPTTGLLQSEGGKVYLSMLDQQLAQNLSGRGLGLAEAMLAQLRRSTAAVPPGETPDLPAAMSLAPPAGLPLQAPSATPLPMAAPDAMPSGPGLPHADPDAGQRPSAGADAAATGGPDDLVARFGAAARAASAASGLPAALILAQAALESGWGRREIRGDDGSRSFNLFGIKADRSWRGPVVETATTEYVAGVPQRGRARFRAYASYHEAFADYAKFITGNPRYASVSASTDATQAAHRLQRAGYATDPEYANKLVRIMQRLA